MATRIKAIASDLKEEGLAIVDIDGDGENELVAGTRWFKRIPGGWQVNTFAGDYLCPRLVVTDLDNDGKLEILMSEGDACMFGKPEGGKLGVFKSGDDPKAPWTEQVLEDMLLDPHTLQVGNLRDRGIEADIILFHNYDFGMWGIDEGMSDNDAVFYLEYLAARLSAYRNVWWSLANEYDLWITSDGVDAVSKTDRRDWDRMGQTIKDADPYNHPVSIHNYGPIYPDRPWMSHVSYQFANVYSLLLDLKRQYGKPVINDEYQYEGNLPYGWGNLSGMETVIRHWLTLMAGGYGTHGECFVVDGNKKDIFWTYGGDMHGESASRLAFMRTIAESMPFQDMEPDHILADGRTKFCLRKGLDAYLYLFLPGSTNRRAKLGPQDGSKPEYEVTVYDAWDCREIKRLAATGLYLANEDPGIVVVKAIRKILTMRG